MRVMHRVKKHSEGNECMNTTSQILLAVAALFMTPLLSVAQEGTMQRTDETQGVRRFRAYLEDDWKRWMVEYPEMATGVGFPGQNRRWSDDSPASIEARKKHLHETLAKLKSISRDTLPES